MTPWQVRRDEMAEAWAKPFWGFTIESGDIRVAHKKGFDAGRRDTLTEEQVIKDLVEALRSTISRYEAAHQDSTPLIKGMTHGTYVVLNRNLAAYDKLIKGEE